MKGLLQNKKNLLPILLGIVIIVVAIIVFLIIRSTHQKESRITTINFPRNQVADAENIIDENTVNNEVTNEVENTTSGDNDDDFGIDEKYQDAAKEFVKALYSEDRMDAFTEGDFFDPVGFLAYDASEDDSDFLGTYSELSSNLSDDEKQEIKNKFIELSNDERNVKITKMEEPMISEEDENISFVFTSLEIDGEEKNIILVFYTNIIVFISNENGESILESDIF